MIAEPRRLGWVWLAAGAVLLLVANGRWPVAPAVWLALPAWLLFVSSRRAGSGLGIAFPVWLGVFFLAWRGIVPAPGWLYFAITGAYALAYFVPLILHRSLAPRLNPLPGTLVFPLAWVGVEFAFQRWITPYGSWMSLAYSQTDLALLQTAALAGTAGVSFLIAWFASALAAAVLGEGRPWWRPLLPWTAAFVLVMVWGEARLLRAPRDVAGMRTASVMPSALLLEELDAALPPLRAGGAVDLRILDRVRARASALNEDLLRRSAREARAGARLVAWSETAGRVLAADEPALLERGSTIAAETGSVLVLAYGVWEPGADPPLRNTVAAIGSDGALAWRYEKAHPIVGPESPLVAAGDGRLRSLRVDGGTLSAAICHDLDFPDLLRQAAESEAGLVVGPSYDWRRITDIHARMARLRAIESGFALLRPTYEGRTLAVDSWGRTRASVDHAEDVVIAHLPVIHLATVSGVLGNWLGWASLAGLAGLAVAPILRKSRR